MSSLIKSLVLCISLSSCATTTLNQSGTRLSGGLYEQFKPLYGMITTEEMVATLGQPNVVSRRDGDIVGYAYNYRRVECNNYSILVYEKGSCKHVNTSFIAIFHKNILRESNSVDETYLSSSKKLSTKPFMELAYMKVKLTAISEILDDSLNRFADNLPEIPTLGN